MLQTRTLWNKRDTFMIISEWKVPLGTVGSPCHYCLFPVSSYFTCVSPLYDFNRCKEILAVVLWLVAPVLALLIVWLCTHWSIFQRDRKDIGISQQSLYLFFSDTWVESTHGVREFRSGNLIWVRQQLCSPNVCYQHSMIDRNSVAKSVELRPRFSLELIIMDIAFF